MRAILAGLGIAAFCAAASGAAPARVVSMNLCTDQLAMLISGPDQLVSVSSIARDPMASAMVAQAARYPVNHGLAEEIVAMKPDLVLASPWSNPATLAILRRVGVAVDTIAPAMTVEDVGTGLRAVGKALGREDRAEELAAAFEADLARLRRDPATGPRAALYYANGYSLGDASLSGQILAAAGLRNIGAEAGLTAGGTLPLEVLVMARPDLIILGTHYDTPSRSEEILHHPALAALGAPRITLPDRDWLCGTPHVLRAIRALQAAR